METIRSGADADEGRHTHKDRESWDLESDTKGENQNKTGSGRQDKNDLAKHD